MGKNIDKNIIKSLNSKYSQKPLDHAKPSPTDAFKTSSKRVIQKRAEATRDLIANKNSDKITRSSKTSLQNDFKTNEEIRCDAYTWRLWIKKCDYSDAYTFLKEL